MGSPMNRLRPRALWGLWIALSLPLGVGCDRSRDDVREWTPQDHDHTGAPSAGQVDTSQPGANPLADHGVSDVILATWKQNCVTCHGVIGRGDGPQGRMLRPPDFTNPVWQKNALDDHMRRTIQKGRGAMPPFGHLPDETVDGLIHLIRLLNRDRANTPAGSTEGAASANGAHPAPGAVPANAAPPNPAPPNPAPSNPAPPNPAPPSAP